MKHLPATLLAAALTTLASGAAHANYKTITVTGYYSIAVDGGYVWGGTSGWAAGWTNPAPPTALWRYKIADGTAEKWTLSDIVGMKGTVAGFVPLTDQVLVLISGNGGGGWNPRPNPPDATYNGAPDRTVDGGIIRYDRAGGTWSIVNVPIYDIQGFSLVGNDLWVVSSVINNPRKYRGYRYDVVTKQVYPIDGLSDAHAIAIVPESDYGIVGTHHGNYLERFLLSTMTYVDSINGGAPETAVTEQIIDVNGPSPPVAKIYPEMTFGLVKAMVKVDSQLWVHEPMGAYYAEKLGGIALIDATTRKIKWATPATWQYRDFGDETALDLLLDAVDGSIIWASGAKGLFKLHRLESPPRLEQVDMDNLPDHNLQHLALDATYVWAGTEQGYLYRYDRTGGTWAICGNWRTSLSTCTNVGARAVPGAVAGLTGTANGGAVTLTWQTPSSPPARSYFVARDDVLVGVVETTTFQDPAVTTGSHKYTVVANEGAYLKGGLLGPGVDTTVNVAAGTAVTPPACGSRPAKIQWGLGEMVYVEPVDLYVNVYEFPNTKGVYPMTCLTWPLAKQIAAWEGKRLPTHDEYLAIAGGALPDGALTTGWEAFYDYNSYQARQFEPSGARNNSLAWDLYDVPGNVMEWQDEYSPLGDGKTYGLAAGGSWPEVSFPMHTYAPDAEMPAGSWSRDAQRYNHSEIGLRAVMGGAQALYFLSPACPKPTDAGLYDVMPYDGPSPQPDAGSAGSRGDAQADVSTGGGGSQTRADGSAGDQGAAAPAGDDSGCGCRTASRGASGAMALLALAGLFALRRRVRGTF